MKPRDEYPPAMFTIRVVRLFKKISDEKLTHLYFKNITEEKTNHSLRQLSTFTEDKMEIFSGLTKEKKFRRRVLI